MRCSIRVDGVGPVQRFRLLFNALIGTLGLCCTYDTPSHKEDLWMPATGTIYTAVMANPHTSHAGSEHNSPSQILIFRLIISFVL